MISKQTLSNRDLLLHPCTNSCFLNLAAIEREQELYGATQLLPGELLKGSFTLGRCCFAEGQCPGKQERGKSLKPWRPQSRSKRTLPCAGSDTTWDTYELKPDHTPDRETLQQSQTRWAQLSRRWEVVLTLKPRKDTLLQDKRDLPLDCSVLRFQKHKSCFPCMVCFPPPPFTFTSAHPYLKRKAPQNIHGFIDNHSYRKALTPLILLHIAKQSRRYLPEVTP